MALGLGHELDAGAAEAVKRHMAAHQGIGIAVALELSAELAPGARWIARSPRDIGRHRLAAERAVLVTAFANVGASGDFGGSYFLTKLVGPSKAKELYMLCERLDATAAARLGLLAVVAFWWALHALNHLGDIEQASSDGKGISDTILIAAGAAAIGYLGWVASRDQVARGSG